MKIAITTPTGKIGSQVTRMLLDDGKNDLVLLARHASKVHDAELRGAKVMEGDQTDREFVKKATRGVDTLFWIVPPDPKTNDARKYYREQAKIAVEAVKANHIKHVVFLSSVGGQLGEGVGIVDVFNDAEKTFRDSVENLRILRPPYFMENLMMSIDGIVHQKSIFLPAKGETPLPMMATRDIASVATELLKTPFKGIEVVEMHGPRDYSFREATKIIGDAIGEKLTFVPTPPEQAIKAMTDRGMSRHMAEQMVGLLQGIEAGRLRFEYPENAGRATRTTFEEFAKTVFAPALAGKA